MSRVYRSTSIGSLLVLWGGSCCFKFPTVVKVFVQVSLSSVLLSIIEFSSVMLGVCL